MLQNRQFWQRGTRTSIDDKRKCQHRLRLRPAVEVASTACFSEGKRNGFLTTALDQVTFEGEARRGSRDRLRFLVILLPLRHAHVTLISARLAARSAASSGER